MYKYAATDSIFDGVSNIYFISIATAFLAVIIAFYCSNFLKDESEKQLQEVLDEMGDDYEVKEDNYVNRDNNDAYNNVQVSRNSNSTHEDSDTESDEVLVDGLISKLKSKRAKDLEARLTRDQLEEEKRIEREQLAAIFELLKKQEAELNMKEIDESELNAQLALYR